MDKKRGDTMINNILDYCEKAQDSLMKYFWDEKEGTFINHTPVWDKENWIYWWHAHTLDSLLDGYLRNKDEKYMNYIHKEFKGVFAKNGNTFLHNWYDDMEWMALALLRLWDTTKNPIYNEQVLLLWDDIKTAWNNQMGGGMAWKKDQLDYKNTPANAPAAIVAFRLYQRFHREEDLDWGNKILNWNIMNLTDPVTGIVWDGLNRQGDGKIDYDWNYTYNQGVVIGALVELYRINQSPDCLKLAIKIATETKRCFIDTNDGIIPYEGKDDCGLFKGIFVRYLFDLIELDPSLEEFKDMILRNAKCIMENGMNEKGLIGGDWKVKEDNCVDLAQHLSGIMMLEMAAKLFWPISE
jgi:predicted alpha-1,6-mannanase (GH76 family)